MSRSGSTSVKLNAPRTCRWVSREIRMPTGLRRSLDPRSPVHGVAHDHDVLPGPVVQRAHHDLARVDADAHDECGMPLGQLRIELCERGAHRQGGADGAVGIILVGLVEAEHGHHSIPDELLDHPDDGQRSALPAATEVVIDGGGGGRDRATGRGRGEMMTIGEQDSSRTALLASRRAMRASAVSRRGVRPCRPSAPPSNSRAGPRAPRWPARRFEVIHSFRPVPCARSRSLSKDPFT